MFKKILYERHSLTPQLRRNRGEVAGLEFVEGLAPVVGLEGVAVNDGVF